MSECSNFSLKHYFEIIEKIKEDFIISKFDNGEKTEKPKFFLRHDVDVDLKAALELAREEAKNRIYSTYFIQVDSPLYNSLEPENIKIIREIKNLGHDIGLHFSAYSEDIKEVERDMNSKFKILKEIVDAKKIVAFHFANDYFYNGDIKFENFINVYEKRFFKDGAKYLSDSNCNWREGCACLHDLKKYGKDLQIAMHPMWWVHEVNNVTEFGHDRIHEEIKKRDKIMDSYFKRYNESFLNKLNTKI